MSRSANRMKSFNLEKINQYRKELMGFSVIGILAVIVDGLIPCKVRDILMHPFACSLLTFLLNNIPRIRTRQKAAN